MKPGRLKLKEIKARADRWSIGKKPPPLSSWKDSARDVYVLLEALAKANEKIRILEKRKSELLFLLSNNSSNI